VPSPGPDRHRRADAALGDLVRLLTATLDPDVVAQRLVDHLLSLFNARTTALFRVEAETGNLVGVAMAGDVGPAGRAPVVIPAGMGMVGLATRARRPVATLDALTDPQLEYTAGVRAQIERAASRAVLAVPVIVRDQVIGAIVIGDLLGRIFDEEEVRLAESIADHAAIALENARLHDAAMRRERALTAVLRSARTVMEAVNLREILARIIDEAARIAGTPHVKIMLVDAAGGVLRLAAVQGTSMPTGSVLPLGEGLSGIVATTGERLFVADARDDLRNPFRDHDRARGMVTYLGLPIRTGGETIGVLTFNTTEPRRYAGEELEYLTAFADQAAVAIRNAQQVATLARSEEHYRAIVEGSVQGILIHTAGTIRFVNQALVRLMRLPGPEPLLGTSVFDFLAPTDRPRIEAYG